MIVKYDPPDGYINSPIKNWYYDGVWHVFYRDGRYSIKHWNKDFHDRNTRWIKSYVDKSELENLKIKLL